MASRLEVIVVSIPRAIVGVTIFASIALNFANIVGRYVFGTPILWVEEILVFAMVWCVFIGAVLVTWEGRHLKMDLLSVMMPPRMRKAINVLSALTFIAVCGFVVAQAWT